MYKKKLVKQSSGKAKQWLIAGVVLLGVLGSGWLAYGYFRGDDMAALNALRDKMRDENLTDDQRRELRGQMRNEWENLSPEQQQVARQSREARFNGEMERHLTAFFALPPAERDKELDKQIDEMEKRRKQWEKRRAERDKDGNNDRGGGGNWGGGGGGNRGARTGADRVQRQVQRLNSTSPEHRAMRSDYFRAMQERRQARGLPPGRGRGGWG